MCGDELRNQEGIDGACDCYPRDEVAMQYRRWALLGKRYGNLQKSKRITSGETRFLAGDSSVGDHSLAFIRGGEVCTPLGHRRRGAQPHRTFQAAGTSAQRRRRQSGSRRREPSAGGY